ncbi:MAG: hypothetical protein AB1938_13305 [Myxococcota bacterium]
MRTWLALLGGALLVGCTCGQPPAVQDAGSCPTGAVDDGRVVIRWAP